jgi:hypothetical protein
MELVLMEIQDKNSQIHSRHKGKQIETCVSTIGLLTKALSINCFLVLVPLTPLVPPVVADMIVRASELVNFTTKLHKSFLENHAWR